MSPLLPILARLAALQSESVDRLALTEAAQVASLQDDPRQQLATIASHLQIPRFRHVHDVDAAQVPALMFHPETGWGLLRGTNALGEWVTEWFDPETRQWSERSYDDLRLFLIARGRLTRPFQASTSPVFQLILREVFSRKRSLVEITVGSIVINLIALITSFYSMQVYDRVIPTGATQTLLVLSVGVFIAIIFDLIAKFARSAMYERLVDQVDQRLARQVFMRFLAVRLDQMPRSVGGLASQLRGYETVRSFLTTVTAYLLVDIPFAIVFVAVIALIAGWVALVPLGFFIFSLAIGLYYRRRIHQLTTKATAAGNLKTGLLVEAVEGSETIKSGQGGWRMLSRWMSVTDEARESELNIRAVSEHASYLTGFMQQICYTLIIAAGALSIGHSGLTQGGLIACSILSGRVLAPVAAIPGQLVQWSQARAALQGLDHVWALQDDHYGVDQPVVLHDIRGDYELADVESLYGESAGLNVQNLTIRAGDKIGIIGPVGAGKTTLLRVLSGMYRPQRGQVTLDGIDLGHISKPVLSERIGYLQQDGRLFSGTLRENLILGLIDPGDEVILQAARATGLFEAVIAKHPKGLQRPIFEGGTGLSGGQRQLVNLTRLFLRDPAVWLLDEPTASMDPEYERQVISALRSALDPRKTLVLVTHKTDMLALVNRIIVIVDHRVLLDGPKDEVLRHLANPAPQQHVQAGARL